MAHEFPTQARIVIVGGGIIGCSVAYHLTKLGWTDVVLLEQGQLSGGTTWHAAGLVGQLRSHSNMTSLIRYSTQLYSELEAETGLASGWKNCGSLSVARTADRMTVLKRTAASARAQGVEIDVISPREAGDLWPVMATDDLVGAVWLPGDGKANPTDLTQSLAKGARNGGAKIFERVKVTGISVRNGVACGVETDHGDIAAEIVVNCAGQWARKVGLMCGVSVPLHSAEHMYIVTGRIEGVHPDLPVMRDPDGFIYFKEEVGGLVMGGFEPHAKPWGMNGIPENFEFALLPDDWDQFEILMENALVRVPQLAEAEVKKFYNGPESFTPDNNFLLGEAPELKNFYVGAGFNSMGIASAGGAGRALAEWIVNGAPTMDLWPVDIRRFASFNNNPRWLHDRVKETLGLHYAMPWPNRELDTARPFRRSPLYDRLAAKGACFGSKMGWERANWFAGPGETAGNDYAFGRQNWHEAMQREMKATREAVAIFDQTSFAKLLVQGRDACTALNRICAGDIDVPVGTSVYTGVLNARGGYESDLTVMRLAAEKFLIVTGSAQAVHDADWIVKNIPADAHAILTDITSAYAVLALMGPRSRDLLGKLSSADLSNAGFPFATIREIDVGYATAYANRMTYVGELGWELIVPIEFAVGVYEALHEAGREFGLADAGYYALDALRIEKGFRAWGRELTPDINPWQAGLGFAVAMDKPGGFIGRDALVGAKPSAAPARRVVLFTLDDAEPTLWGGELILRDGKPVGEVRSAAYGHTLGRSVALGLIEHEAGVDASFLANGRFEIDLAGVRHAVTAHLRSPYDPKSERVKADAVEIKVAA
ncbi:MULTISPECIES: FAD-dependent oxidoreductase [unclassified Mesorhizobium]|uniref:GcvT family protein n=1 Tax=unclassified Mesorhizobium TaxID=325217 RepID=UPI000FD95C40|nr:MULTISPECIES: FAD-dependent oxidoreductase [unclassified Mesorhizobium]TGU33161.1 FAD-dependent oxidoreductase [bacterium M00.F.Ca.ET.156.01.1.1]TGV87367.1 FAD-dependent oxidoreductase [Mesorhizobium sp. M00.F.Ca.ET.149.01.1.1]TGR27450.1 FAD-dependent oxidoreductase [Mesorhizobium sp. M8A.F.Ca.ET.202.01.1.1]TGR28467.1 FAD-dependent oxidoreductase [Mesorhizobium sp. M8A.F.Ca.ET.197.01.1.1]TGR54482.1 FAD-dependent oxidoreductase [Mesorhizobium sp. M8A.F.Ca.ET.198.01.1.1]